MLARTSRVNSFSQRRQNDNVNKICVLEGVREEENIQKLSKNAVFPENSMTMKFGNFANFIVRYFVVIWEAPIQSGPPSPGNKEQVFECRPRMVDSRKTIRAFHTNRPVPCETRKPSSRKPLCLLCEVFDGGNSALVIGF